MSLSTKQHAISWLKLNSPIGCLTIVSDGESITEIRFPNNSAALFAEHEPSNRCLQQAVEQLSAYFDGRLKTFDLPLSLHGSDFQNAVWTQLQKVAHGTTASYGQIAAALGKPKAARAVGMANNKNRIPIIIPCHRIIGRDGSLTGFAGGLKTKRWLLHHEGVSLEDE